MRVSRSGTWTSVVRPHSKRVRRRSSSELSWRGDLSELMTICLLALCSVLKVWKNSSCVRSARSMNWMSSISSRSTDAVPGLEGLHLVIAHRVDEVVREFLARDVARAQPRLQPLGVVPDRVQQVGLAQPGVAVDEQRVVGAGRRLGHGDRGRVGEAVARTDDEGVERVLRVEAGIPVVVGVLGADRTPGAAAGGGSSTQFSSSDPPAKGLRARRALVARVRTPPLGPVGRARAALEASTFCTVTATLMSRPEFGAEHRGEHGAQLRLDEVLGELVGRGEDSGVADQTERPGQPDPRLLLRAQRWIGEAGDRAVPDGDEFCAVVHGPVHSRLCVIAKARHSGASRLSHAPPWQPKPTDLSTVCVQRRCPVVGARRAGSRVVVSSLPVGRHDGRT